MTFHKFSVSASTLCATGTLLVLGGFLAVNLAGCGGGGGGSTITRPTQAPFSGNVRLLDSLGSEVTSGTLTLTPASGTGAAISRPLSSTGFMLTGVPVGLYTASVTLPQGTGTSPVEVTSNGIYLRNLSTSPATFSFNNNQNSSDTRTFLVSGRVLLNPDGSNPIASCGAESQKLADTFLLIVRDLDSASQPVIARLRRANVGDTANPSDQGNYTITLPYRPRTFRVEVAQPVAGTARLYAGQSALLTFNSTDTSIENVDICVNTNGRPPLPPTPTPVPTTTEIPPFATGTAGAIAATATARAEATAEARATGTAQANATGTAQVTATANAAATATQQSVNATATANANATATATRNGIGG